MKIALVNWNLNKVGGSQSFTHTLATAFEQLGHSVTKHDTHFEGEADLVILSQPSHCTALTNAPIIQVSHSSFVPLERFTNKSSYRVSVSQEIKQLEEKLGFDSVVINNPIDTSIFKLLNLREKCGRVLYMSHDGALARETIQSACRKKSVDFAMIENSHNIAEDIHRADVCIGIGRCLLEAMACGKNVISGDHRNWMDSFKGAGLIEPDRYTYHTRDNFSGRLSPREVTEQMIIDAIENYDPDRGIKLSKLVKRTHDAKAIARQYLRLISN